MESLIVKGGWVMGPIIAASVVALALVLERIWFFWGIALDTERFAKQVFTLTEIGDGREASELCSRTTHPIAAVFQAGLEHASEDAAELERVMEREGNRQVMSTEKNLNFLMVVVGILPLMGFLGTILGLIQAFMAWEKLGASVTVSALASGIYQAMITTAAGLIFAIPYFVIYHVFLSHVARIAADLNHYGDEFVSVLVKAQKRKK